MAEQRPTGAAGAKVNSSDLKLRFASAVVLGPLVLAIAWFGGAAYTGLVLVGILLFLREWFGLTGTPDASKRAVSGYVAILAMTAAFALGRPELALGLVPVSTVAVWLLGGRRQPARWAAEGVLYSGLALYSVLGARAGEGGQVFLLFLLIVVWATDIAAYFAGRAIGGPKLWPRVSPKKTWSGATGGLIAAVVLGVGLVAFFGRGELWAWALLAAVLSITSQAGDLMESAIKRRFDAKDSGRLIPGHGGIMDRIDGLVAAAIMAAVLGLVFGGSLAEPISSLVK